MRRSWLQRLSGMVVFLTLFAGVPIGSAEGPKLTLQNLLQPRLSQAARPSGVQDEWKVLRVTRAGRKEYLVLFEHLRYRFDQWSDNDVRGVGGKGDVGQPKQLTDEQVLAIVNETGKILHEAAIPAEARIKGELHNVAHDIPLVMDSTNDCPYAIVDAAGRTLWCYDHQLAFKMKREIPLQEIGYPKVTFDGERYTLWLFGNRFIKAPEVAARVGKQDGTPDRRGETSAEHKEEAKNVSSFIGRFDVPHGPAEALGVRYDVRENFWEPMPLSTDELIDELDTVARGPKGQRLQVQPASLHITPFRDLKTEESFGVLIEGEAASEYGNRALFAGTRLFFRSTMDRQGLGKIVQIPLWIVQEDRKDVVLNEDTGEYRFPMFNVERDLQAFGFGKNNLTLVFQWFFKVPQEDGSYGHGGRGSQFMLIFSSNSEPPRILDLSPSALNWDTAHQRFSMDDLDVYPLQLVDRIGRSAFAFRAVCEDRRDAHQRALCVAIMELE